MKTDSISNRFGTVLPGKRRTAAIHLVQSSRFARRMAKLLIFGLLASIAAMAFLPWQQTSRGTGQVVTFAPQERQQEVKSRVKGVIVKIKEGLQDNSYVKKDQVLMEIQPFSANMVKQLNDQLNTLETKFATSMAKAELYKKNIEEFKEARDAAVEAAQAMVESANEKLESKRRQVSAYIAKENQARLNFERQNDLYKAGIKPLKEIEKLQKDVDVAKAELQAVYRDVASAEQEVDAKKHQLKEKRRLGQTKVESTRASYEEAMGQAAAAEKDQIDIRIKLGQMDGTKVLAPRDGTVLRLNVNELGTTVKEGDSLLTMVPESSQNSVELFVNGNDMPLVQAGQDVRLQFEGWPAVQFAGWPSVAVGTFAGKVANIDATDNGKGEFRSLVTPDDEDQEWPSDRYLRQGVRANGWVMLRRVSLGYEIWRQLNGFPVIVSEKEPSKEIKTPKLPE
ncbi:MAG: HlyD family efflux transporter periplasmic adaptor subunit [Planctomycetota bacterium]